MSIESFYNTTAIYEIPTITVDAYGQDTKVWSVSTTIIGRLQGRSGNKSIFNNNQEKADYNERFYCGINGIGTTGRLLFSTGSFSYMGTSTSSTALSSTEIGALYFVSGAFSTYAVGDYLAYSSTGYGKRYMIYREIIYINDRLLNRHYQIDLQVDYADRS